MSRLEDRLARIRKSSAEKMPDEAKEIAHRATQELVDSGAVERAMGVTDEAPRFELEDSRGHTVDLSGLLANGPAVITFFRGHW